MALRQRHVHGVHCLVGGWAGRSIDTPLPPLVASAKARPVHCRTMGATSRRTIPPKGHDFSWHLLDLIEIGADFGVVHRAHAEASPSERDSLLAGPLVPERTTLEPLGVHVVTERAGDISGIVGRRSGWPFDAVD